MAIRNIAQSIRVGEISLGVAVGVESMSLKSVLLVRSLRRDFDASRRVSVALQVPSVLIILFSFAQSPPYPRSS